MIMTLIVSDNESNLIFSLLPTLPYKLAYSLPLILSSFLLTFAGTFLILDRTRTFPNLSNVGSTSVRSRLRAFLQGGAGGCATGFVFGVHFSTFAALLIPARTQSPSLTPITFLVTWVLSSVLTMVLAGRWKYVTFAFAAIAGYTTFALAFSVMVHPSQLTRIILTAIIAPIGTLVSLFVPREYQHIPLRIATSALGAFGVILSIALFAQIPAWGSVWERYWLSDSLDWGTSAEKGLSAAYCLLLCLGVTSDWVLHHQFGENPDEKWDRCLADYGANFSTPPNRPGVFVPPVSLWDRLRHWHFNFSPVTQPTFSTTAFGRDLSDMDPPKSRLKRNQGKAFILPTYQPGEYPYDRKYDLSDSPSSAQLRKPLKFPAVDDGNSDSDEEATEYEYVVPVNEDRRQLKASTTVHVNSIGDNRLLFWKDVKTKAEIV